MISKNPKWCSCRSPFAIVLLSVFLVVILILLLVAFVHNFLCVRQRRWIHFSNDHLPNKNQLFSIVQNARKNKIKIFHTYYMHCVFECGPFSVRHVNTANNGNKRAIFVATLNAVVVL